MKFTFTRNTRNNELLLTQKTFDQTLGMMADEKTLAVVEKLRSAVPYLNGCYNQFEGINKWSRVYPTAEFTKDNNGNMLLQTNNGLLLLSFSGLSDSHMKEEAKCSAAILPSTFAVIESADGVGVHVLVRYVGTNGELPKGEPSARQLYKSAFTVASSVYRSVVNGRLIVSSLDIRDSFLMTYDKSPYVNNNAVPLVVNSMARTEMADAQQLFDVDEVSAKGLGEDAGSKKKDSVKDTIQKMIKFLTDKYSFRYNMIMKYTEYYQRDGWRIYRPVDPRMQKQMTLEVQLADIRVSIKDVRNFLESNMIRNYYPVDDFLFECDGKWDGKDHIRKLARTVPTDNPYWEDWFYTWFLAMVDQWKPGDRRTYGNSIVPLLISKQGYNKSTFCRRLIPDDMQWGYNDNLVLSEKRQVLQAMSQFMLINLDEFNQINPNIQQGFLKNLVQLPAVKVKRPYGGHVEEFPRLASFIATSNIADVLSDPSGNRRFLGVELTGPIDVSERPNYVQLYAQTLAALDRGEKPYFDTRTTAEIMAWNGKYQIMQPLEHCFFESFAITLNEKEGEYLTVATIYNELKRKYGTTILGKSLVSFGRKLKNMEGIKSRHTSKGTEYLVVRK